MKRDSVFRTRRGSSRVAVQTRAKAEGFLTATASWLFLFLFFCAWLGSGGRLAGP